MIAHPDRSPAGIHNYLSGRDGRVVGDRPPLSPRAQRGIIDAARGLVAIIAELETFAGHDAIAAIRIGGRHLAAELARADTKPERVLDDVAVRLQCLHLAASELGGDAPAQSIVDRAQAYVSFTRDGVPRSD